MRYQRPRWNSSRYGSIVRSSSWYRSRPGVRLDTAPKSRARFGSAGQRRDVDAEVAGAVGDQPAELQQPLGGGQALDLHRRGGQVQGGQLVGGEARVAEGVLLAWDAVAVDLRAARRAPSRPAAGCPSSRSSSLSRSKARRNAAWSSG